MSGRPGIVTRLASLVAGALLLGAALASDIAIEDARSEIVNDMFLVSADANFDFSDDAIRALESGVPIFFELEVRITRRRRLLWDPEVVSTHRRYSVERHALSDQYILTDLITGDRRVHRSLGLAIEDLGRIRDLPLAEVSELDVEPPYDLSLRLRLDIESLPAPMVPLAYLSPGWHMSSGWYRWKTDR